MTEDGIHLICSSGIRSAGATIYRFGGATAVSRFAPSALVQLKGLRGRVSVLVTDAARQVYPELAAELEANGLSVQCVDIPDGRDTAETLEIVRRVVDVVVPGEHVIVDVTHGLRHLPFIYLAVLTFLTAHRDVVIDGIFYGALELAAQQPPEAPIIDVTSLFRLTQWYHALQSAQESGDLRQVAALADRESGDLFDQQRLRGRVVRLRDVVGRLAPPLASGLPAEVGLMARDLRQALSPLQRSPAVSPALRLSLDPLASWAGHWTVPNEPTKKADIRLDDDELERQWRLADWYADRGDVHHALLVLRELVVNLVLLRLEGGRNWLERGTRRRAEATLHAFAERVRANVATPTEKATHRIWSAVQDPRNRYAHAGMRPDNVDVPVSRVKQWLADCLDLLRDGTLTFTARPSTGTVLITPLGHSPGIIFTALRWRRPDQLVVVTSTEAQGRLAEALAAVGGDEVFVQECLMRDPHGGFGEAERLFDESIRDKVLAADEVFVNVTGGTTAMQYVVERMARIAAGLGADVRRIALIDPRPLDVQRLHPFVEGRVVELDQDVEVGDGDDQ